jgi:hypothetical protein
VISTCDRDRALAVYGRSVLASRRLTDEEDLIVDAEQCVAAWLPSSAEVA